MPNMLLFENFLDQPEPLFGSEQHIRVGQLHHPGLQDNCAPCELPIAMQPDVNKSGCDYPAGRFGAEEVLWLHSARQESSCADMDSTHTQNMERTGTNIPPS